MNTTNRLCTRFMLTSLGLTAISLHPAAAKDQAPDVFAINGLPATLQCSQVADSKGGVQINFTATRWPLPGSQNGTATTISGTLRQDGTTSGMVSTMDNDSDPTVEKVKPDALAVIGKACRSALAAVPGTGG